MKIVDNFLPEKEFKDIQSLIMGFEFPWFYCSGCSYPDDGAYHMAHVFYQPDVGTNSKYLHIWEPMLDRLEVSSLDRIKANMMMKFPEVFFGDYHSDNLGKTTGILYINTNDGYTEMENGVRVNSIENRYLSFDTSLIHRAKHCTKDLRRIVVNFNYSIL